MNGQIFNGHPDQQYGHLSYAHNGDDFMVLNLFELIEIREPSYLDLGAHHPTNGSNTKLLYDRGSRGVNVDANPNLIYAFDLERPEDKNVQVGVGPRAGMAEFFMYSDTSGRNTFSREEVKQLEGTMIVRKNFDIPVKTITQIVEEHCDGLYPQFLSCDIEGLDFEVLKSADFSVSFPFVICVETRREASARMIEMLDQKGFFVYCRMGENLFFVFKGLKSAVF